MAEMADPHHYARGDRSDNCSIALLIIANRILSRRLRHLPSVELLVAIGDVVELCGLELRLVPRQQQLRRREQRHAAAGAVGRVPCARRAGAAAAARPVQAAAVVPHAVVRLAPPDADPLRAAREVRVAPCARSARARHLRLVFGAEAALRSSTRQLLQQVRQRVRRLVVATARDQHLGHSLSNTENCWASASLVTVLV